MAQEQKSYFQKYKLWGGKDPHAPSAYRVKTIQAGENSSFIFAVGVRSVPSYHFKLAYVILYMAVKETHF